MCPISRTPRSGPRRTGRTVHSTTRIDKCPPSAEGTSPYHRESLSVGNCMLQAAMDLATVDSWAGALLHPRIRSRRLAASTTGTLAALAAAADAGALSAPHDSAPSRACAFRTRAASAALPLAAHAALPLPPPPQRNACTSNRRSQSRSRRRAGSCTSRTAAAPSRRRSARHLQVVQGASAAAGPLPGGGGAPARA